jgi:hypothetical protein
MRFLASFTIANQPSPGAECGKSPIATARSGSAPATDDARR